MIGTGASKADVVKETMEPSKDEGPNLPIARVFPVGELHWFLDSAAASTLEKKTV